MISEEIRKQLVHDGYDSVALYENQSYDYSLIGVDDNGRAVYDYDMMIDELADEYFKETPGLELEDAYTDAVDWIGYNTLRGTPYQPNGPIVLGFNPEDDSWINMVNGEPYDTSKIEYFTKTGEDSKSFYIKDNKNKKE